MFCNYHFSITIGEMNVSEEIKKIKDLEECKYNFLNSEGKEVEVNVQVGDYVTISSATPGAVVAKINRITLFRKGEDKRISVGYYAGNGHYLSGGPLDWRILLKQKEEGKLEFFIGKIFYEKMNQSK